MGLPIGRTNNPNGRPKGSQNRNTEEIRSMIFDLLNTNLVTIQSDLDSLNPKDRLKFISSILPYAVPRLQFQPPSNDNEVKREDLEEMFDKLFPKLESE
tara:strand:+ start:2199 stop:2495 length:297 start_codon:yes stop_codon:yes gene_type:complete